MDKPKYFFRVKPTSNKELTVAFIANRENLPDEILHHTETLKSKDAVWNNIASTKMEALFAPVFIEDADGDLQKVPLSIIEMEMKEQNPTMYESYEKLKQEFDKKFSIRQEANEDKRGGQYTCMRCDGSGKAKMGTNGIDDTCIHCGGTGKV